jgi:deazaflavin-dependent oxidoreductase (nitroreductase family)
VKPLRLLLDRLRALLHAWALRPSFTKFGKAVARPLDLLTRRTGVPFSALATGVPTVYLTSTGAKTGEPRVNPVFAIDISGGVGLVASNWGQNIRPGWHYNLLANPRCELQRGRLTTRHIARPAKPEERDEIWRKATEIYPPWNSYANRVDRELDMFVLEPAREHSM